MVVLFFFFFSSRRRHTRCGRDWSSDVCSSDLGGSMVVYKLVVQGNGALATSTTVGSQLLLTSSDPLYTPVVHEAVLNVRGPQLETGNVLQATKYAYAQAIANIVDAVEQSNMLWKINPDLSLTLYGRSEEHTSELQSRPH